MKPRFTAAKEAKRRARLGIGLPPGTRVIPDKRRKRPKHKKPLREDSECEDIHARRDFNF